MIKIDQVTKDFKETLLEYPSIELEYGKSYLVLGASGSGKSTLLNMLAGISTPTTGQIILDGTDIRDMSKKEKEIFRANEIGYIFQDFKLIEDMTVEDNIRIMEITGSKTRDLEKITRALGIKDKLHRRVRTLSGGEKQRVAIARAMVKNPCIILADEPTGSLNIEIAEAIIKALLALSRKKLLIVATHDVRFVTQFTQVIDLSRGDTTC